MKVHSSAHSIILMTIALLYTATVFAQKSNTLTAKEKKEGWSLLFDGKTGDNWIAANSDVFPDPAMGKWVVKNGTLTILNTGGEMLKSSIDIVTKKEYGAFDLTFDFKISRGANSGVKYFVVLNDKKSGSGVGLEYQVLDDEVHPDAKLGRFGNRTLSSLYDLIPAHKPAAAIRPVGEWNTGRIVVYPNNRVEHYLNGVKVLEYVRKSPAFVDSIHISKFKGIPNFGLSDKGHILLQDHGFEVNYRNMKIKEL